MTDVLLIYREFHPTELQRYRAVTIFDLLPELAAQVAMKSQSPSCPSGKIQR